MTSDGEHQCQLKGCRCVCGNSCIFDSLKVCLFNNQNSKKKKKNPNRQTVEKARNSQIESTEHTKVMDVGGKLILTFEAV